MITPFARTLPCGSWKATEVVRVLDIIPLVRAHAVFAFSKIAVHAKDLETRRVVVAFEPVIELHAATAKFLFLLIPTTFSVVDGKKFIDERVTACALWATVGVKGIETNFIVDCLAMDRVNWRTG